MLVMMSCSTAPTEPKATGSTAGKKLTAKIHDSGFADAHDTYNGMGVGSDGRIYYILCSEKADVAGQMYAYDPATDRITHLGDLTEASGEKGKKVISQGKSHVQFVESNGKLYFATHLGFYSMIDGMEKIGVPPAGMHAYPGGHLLAFDMKSGRFEDLGVEPHQEGFLTMNMDAQRHRIYALTWPTGYFIRYDLAKKEMKDLGPYFEKGENGKGATYRTVCRSFAINPDDGAVFFSTGEGAIHRYDYDKDAIETVSPDELKKDYFGLYDITSPGHMAYNWRQVVYHPADKLFYGVHGNSGYLFRFDPRNIRVDLIDRITSEPSQRSGMFDQFSYGYLGFTLGPDGRTIYYLTGGPVYENGKRVAGKSSTAKGEAKVIENLHLITYDIPGSKYTDHGPIFLENGERPAYVNSIAVAKDGTVYTMSRVTRNGKVLTDLISVKP